MESYTNSSYFAYKVEQEGLDSKRIGLELLKEDIEEEVDIEQLSLA